MKKKTALILGAAGFVGSHMAIRLRKEGYSWVEGVDKKRPDYNEVKCHHLGQTDLRDKKEFEKLGVYNYDEIYQFAADMGGAQFIFTGDNDADIMHNSSLINLNLLDSILYYGKTHPYKGKIFYSSSACVYPQELQSEAENKGLKEVDAYPVNPDSEYGFEKIFSERLYDAYKRNYGLNVRVARFHNIFGEYGTYKGDRAKSPAAICRKVAEAKNGDSIEIWGDGLQTRSFLYIDECIEGVRRLMQSDYTSPLNIGSDKMISINDLAKMVIDISGKDLTIKNVESNALGVRGRNSNNDLIKEVLNWSPSASLRSGMEKLYSWVNKQVNG